MLEVPLVYRELALLLLQTLLLDLHILLAAHLHKDSLLRDNKDILNRVNKEDLDILRAVLSKDTHSKGTLKAVPSKDTLNRGTLSRALASKHMDSLLSSRVILSKVILNRAILSRAISSSLLLVNMAIKGTEWPRELPQGPLLGTEHRSTSIISHSSTLLSSMELLVELLVVPLVVIPAVLLAVLLVHLVVVDRLLSTWEAFSEQYRRMESRVSTLLSDCSRLPAPLVL